MATIVPGNRTWKFYRERENDNTDYGERLITKDEIEAQKINKWVQHVRKNMQNGDVVLVQSGKAWYHKSVTK